MNDKFNPDFQNIATPRNGGSDIRNHDRITRIVHEQLVDAFLDIHMELTMTTERELGPVTVKVRYLDNPDNTENWFDKVYDYGDFNIVGDLTRLLDRLSCLYKISARETLIAEKLNLINPVYKLPTFADKGKVNFTDASSGKHIKVTLARPDYKNFDNKLSASYNSPPPRSNN